MLPPFFRFCTWWNALDVRSASMYVCWKKIFSKSKRSPPNVFYIYIKACYISDFDYPLLTSLSCHVIWGCIDFKYHCTLLVSTTPMTVLDTTLDGLLRNKTSNSNPFTSVRPMKVEDTFSIGPTWKFLFGPSKIYFHIDATSTEII